MAKKREPATPVAATAQVASGPIQSGLFGSSAVSVKSDPQTLANLTGTSALVLATLKAAYGWTDKTRLTRAEFLAKRDAWLCRPAKEA